MSNIDTAIRRMLDSLGVPSRKEIQESEFDYTEGTLCYKVVQLYHGKLYSCGFNPKKTNSYLIEYPFNTKISSPHNWSHGIYTFNKVESANYYRHIEVFGRSESTIDHDIPLIDHNEKTGSTFIILKCYGFGDKYPMKSAFFHDLDSLSQFYINKVNNNIRRSITPNTSEKYEYGQTICFDSIYIPSQRNTAVINYLADLYKVEIIKLDKDKKCTEIQRQCDMENLKYGN